MKTNFRQVITTKQIDTVVHLADTIWREHYAPIIGIDQVAYMLRTYHSADTIADEINNKGYLYYLIFVEDMAVGYFGVKPQNDELFLSKFYILSAYRGHGIGTACVVFLKSAALSHHAKKITLTVNKHNTNSIAAYKKIGFEIVAEVCADIGEGYVMDDYKMEFILP